MPKTAKSEPTQTTQDILTAEQIQELTEKLQAERTTIMELYDRDVRSGQQATGEGTDDIVDRANSAYNRELSFSLSTAEREHLIQIDEALKRFEDDTYGFCMHSGQPIALARLRAVPWARYTIEVQEMAEQGLLEDY